MDMGGLLSVQIAQSKGIIIEKCGARHCQGH